jgi:Luciferase-like monooxygenase
LSGRAVTRVGTICGWRGWPMTPASTSCCRSRVGRAMAATPTTRARRFETVAWLCGLLALTRLGTVHAPLFNPLIAAKEFVTADLIGEGRFGLNLVVGWNEDEFEMFGVKQRDHVFRASQQFFNQPCSRCR